MYVYYYIVYYVSRTSRGESAPSHAAHSMYNILLCYIQRTGTCAVYYIFFALVSPRAHALYILYIYNIIRIIIIIYYYNISYYYTDICAPYKRKLCGAPPDAMRSGSIRQPAAAFRVSRRPRVLDDYILPFVSYTHTHTHPTPLGRCNRAPSSGSFTSPPPPPQLSPSARDVWT